MLEKLVQLEQQSMRERADIGPSLPLFTRGRLTLVSDDAFPIADQSAKTTLYWTPILGHEGAEELSISLSGMTADLPADVFLETANTLSLTDWTNATTRATALVRQNGYWSKTGDLSKRYVGTVLGNATGGQVDDTVLLRGVWNMYNRAWRYMTDYVYPGGTPYQYNTASWRQVGGLSALGSGRVGFVLGFVQDLIIAIARPYQDHRAASQYGADGIGFNDTTGTTGATSSILQNMYNSGNTGRRYTITAISDPAQLNIGYNYIALIEKGHATLSCYRLDNTLFAAIRM